MKRFLTKAGRSVPTWAYLLPSLMTVLIGPAIAAEPVKVKGAGIWHTNDEKHRLSESHQQHLLKNLKQITGLHELAFTKDGQFQLGAIPEENCGSAAARHILQRAIDSGYVFFIEDYSNSPMVNFGQLDEGTRYEDDSTNRRFLIWRIRLDFDDFHKVAASRDVRESFSIGFTFLHELLHGLGHRDAKKVEEIGECEELINKARMEMSLPTRDQYFATQLKITDKFFTLRLRFHHHARQKSEYLYFMAGPDSNLAEVAEGVVNVRKQPR